MDTAFGYVSINILDIYVNIWTHTLQYEYIRPYP